MFYLNCFFLFTVPPISTDSSVKYIATSEKLFVICVIVMVVINIVMVKPLHVGPWPAKNII